MAASCPHCACNRSEGAAAHAMLALLREDDLDAALESGLMASAPCPGCDPDCNARLAAACDARRSAFQARERYRKRAQRLAQRKAARDAARRPAPIAIANAPGLPAAAADALARALAKASGAKPR